MIGKITVGKITISKGFAGGKEGKGSTRKKNQPRFSGKKPG